MDQTPPQGDNRYRVHRSAKFYTAELLLGLKGGTWYLIESAERVVHRDPSDREWVMHNTLWRRLRPPEDLIELAARHFAFGGTLVIGGRPIYADDDERSFDPHPFINITPMEDRKRYEEILVRSQA